MDETLFRKKNLERISSPEALGDYLRVTSPTVWLILIAVILLLAGILVWSSLASIDSFAGGTAQAQDGMMHIYFDNEQIARNVKTGMTVVVGDTESKVGGFGQDAEGRSFAFASTTLADGTYSARIVFRRTQVLELLFN